MALRWLGKPLAVVGLTALGAAAVLWGGGGPLRALGAALLLFILPGFGWVRLVLGRGHGLAPLEHATLSLAASYPVALVVMLLASYVPGPLTLPLSLAAGAAGILLPWPFVAARERRLDLEGRAAVPSPRPIPTASAAILAVILLASAFLMFAHLGTSEFQGDEAMALFDAGGALRGDDSALFYHRKAPAEILLPAGVWALAGTLDETRARLPFAWAGLLAVALMYVLGRRAFGPNGWTPAQAGATESEDDTVLLPSPCRRGAGGEVGARGEIVGLGAAALYALNGYVIGFSRIVQYQSVVMMASAAAVLCFCLFSRRSGPRYQVLGAIFLAAGLLAHYDAVFALFPVAYLYWYWLRSSEGSLPGEDRPWPALAAALAVGLGMVALFYVPFLQPGYLAQTADYLQFRSGGKAFYNNLPLWLTLSTTYNSTYYIACLLGFVAAAVAGPARRAGRPLRLALGLALGGVALALWLPDTRVAGAYDAAFAPFLALAVVVYLLLRPSMGLRMAWVWFAVPFVVYNFLFVQRPGTHFWTMYAGLALLGGAGLCAVAGAIWPAARRRPLLAAASGAVLVGLALWFGYYLYIAFVRPYPEFRAAYGAARSPLYWTPYDRLPERDFFGFAHRAGWKAIGQLYAEGALSGEYDSNEGGEITTWYLPDAPRHACKPRPRYYFLAESVQDAAGVPLEELDSRLAPVGLVTVDGRPGIHIYERGASAEGAVREFALADYEARFDAARRPLDRREYMGQFITRTAPARFGDLADLLGYDLDQARSCPGGEAVLTLYWRRAGPPILRSYKAFVHLGDGRLVAQADDVPGCGGWPTTAWRPGEIVADRHVLELPPDAPAGDHALSVGLYEPDSGARLPVTRADGAAGGDSLTLGTVPVRDECE